MAYFQVYKSQSSTAYYYSLKATDTEEIIMESEGYATKYAAMQGLESARSNARFEQSYESKGGVFHTFVLKAWNGETVGKSKKYLSASERDRVLDLVKQEAPGAGILDMTVPGSQIN